MKKNEIRFIATEMGINVEGNATLCVFDREKAEKNLSKVQQAAENCGASLSLSPTGIQLGFNVGLSPDIERIREANMRMKCIVEQMKDFIRNLDDAHEKTTEDEIIAKQQHEAVDKFFDEMHGKYPKANIAIVCDDGGWVSVAGNMNPMHTFTCLMGALISKQHGENQ